MSDATLATGAAPDVSQGAFFILPASAQTITNFTGGELGQVIFITSHSASATTLQNSAGGIVIHSAVGVNSAGIVTVTTGNYVMAADETKGFVYNGTSWTEINQGIRVQ
jgi:hypothetical protein